MVMARIVKGMETETGGTETEVGTGGTENGVEIGTDVSLDCAVASSRLILLFYKADVVVTTGSLMYVNALIRLTPALMLDARSVVRRGVLALARDRLVVALVRREGGVVLVPDRVLGRLGRVLIHAAVTVDMISLRVLLEDLSMQMQKKPLNSQNTANAKIAFTSVISATTSGTAT